jgi:hypothetical protein
VQGDTYSLRLEGFNGLHMAADVVRDRLEVAHGLLGLVHDSLVLEQRAVVRDVDSGGLVLESVGDALRVTVPLAERLERSDGLCKCQFSIHNHKNIYSRRTLAEPESRVDARKVLKVETTGLSWHPVQDAVRNIRRRRQRRYGRPLC